MIKERGFIFPVTLIFLFFLASSFFHQTMIYEREKKLQFEHEQHFMMDHLVQMAIADFFSLTMSGELFSSDYFRYPEGTVYYWLIEENDEFVHIEFTVITKKNRQRHYEIKIDKQSLAVVKWEEFGN